VKHEHSRGPLTAIKTSVAAAAIVAAFAGAPIAAHAQPSDPVLSTESAANLRLSVFGLTADQRLVRFRVATPQVLQQVGAVSGVQAPDRTIVGIDFRVQDGKLYGLGDGGGLYTIDTSNAGASLVTRVTLPTPGARHVIDFNPAANALRIVSDQGDNLRIPFAGPTQFQLQIDDKLDYPPGAPVNTVGPTATGIAGIAYTNNDLDAATVTTLFDIDASRNQVAIQSPPNNGSLVPTGSLGVDPDAPVGFDIYSVLRNGAAVRNSAFASLVVNGVAGFYRVDVLTGKVGLIGNFNDNVVDIALPLNQ
jgi:hypothetical protein